VVDELTRTGSARDPLAPARGSERREPWLAALAVAGGILVAIELLGALSHAAFHPLGYVAFCVAATLALAAGVGWLGARARLSVPVVLAVWAGLSTWIVLGPVQGLAVLAVGLIAIALVRGLANGMGTASHGHDGSVGWLVYAVAAGAGLSIALQRYDRVVEILHLDVLPSAFAETVAAAGLFAAAFLGAPGIVALSARVPRKLVAALCLGCAVHPTVQPYPDRPSGTARYPRPDEMRADLAPASPLPDVFLLVLDTVRADHLSVYGYTRDTTPELSRRVRSNPRAVVFPRAYSNGSWTVPSHASLFTGLDVGQHGTHFDLEGTVRYRFSLPEDAATLAERVGEAGYATLGTFSNNWLNVMEGMDRGFLRYFRSKHDEPLPFVGEGLRSRFLPGLFPEVVKGGSRAEAVNDTILSLVDGWKDGPRPLYVFANFADAHGPYDPVPEFRGRFRPPSLFERPEHLSIDFDARHIDALIDRYDEEIAYLDHQLGFLLDELDRRGVLDRSWVFVTSDHGEAFAEHGVTEHGTNVYDEVVRVPLIVLPPAGVWLDRHEGPVSLVDVAATIAGIAGTSLEGPGRDLRILAGRATSVSIQFYGDAYKARLHGPLAAEAARAVVHGRYKLIEYRNGRIELYDVLADPGEREDLADELPERAEELRALLEPYGETTPAGGGSGAGTNASLRQIRNWGYAGE